MAEKPTYGGLEQKVEESEKESFERKRAEEDLKHQKRRLESLIEYSSLAIVTLDEGHNIVSCNRDFEKLFQFEESEIIGKNLDAVIAREEYMENAMSYTKETIEGKPTHGSAKRYRKDGTLIHVDFFGVPVIIDDKVVGAYGIYLDIGERKRAEELLKRSEEKFAKAFHYGPTLMTISSIEDGKYMEVNETFVRITGYSREESIGTTSVDLGFISEEDLDELKQELMKNRRIDGRELTLNKKHGDTMSCLYFGEIITIDGEQKLLSIASDITERRKAEEDLRQRNEALSRAHKQRKILSKRLVDLLENDRRQIAGELHDHIGQTLTSLKMDIEMIHGKLKPEQRALRARITEVQEKAIQAIKDVKNISRGLRPGILDALGLVPSLRELFNEIQQQTDIEIQFFCRGITERFAPEKEVAIYRIAQEALNNIIRNAKAKNVFVNLVEKDGQLLLSVEDDGVGFDLDKVMTFSKKGGPLGILIMQERAEQLEGEFTLESQVGKGTHVLVEIPL